MNNFENLNGAHNMPSNNSSVNGQTPSGASAGPKTGT
jgi:hypothetical protein